MKDKLSRSAENLLKEILKHYNEKMIVDVSHFCGRLDFENEEYQSCLKELSDKGLISIMWADDGPYSISLTVAGKEYLDSKIKAEKDEYKEKRSSRLHELLMIIISVLLSGIVELILFRLL